MSGIFSFFKSVLGTGDRAASSGDGQTSGRREIYKDHEIVAQPISEGGQFRVAGSVISPEGKEHNFVRADMFSSREDAEATALQKGQRLVDEMGSRLFAE
ncbi:HlyU family transcriptional regulator [Pseudohoeflea coraliihabitans]|uniref:Transcriptional regulator n=1 Tax=Pseudohoeflea coraliihabitans TaxID=2860393 RepID=A0ABS6WQP4_9HYPH|nr:transcriptional regulator [Pseudohoeflea sp. DP4N28-3]